MTTASIMHFEDLVKETSTTTGTGTLTLAGAVTGFRTFLGAFGADSDVYYSVLFGSEWEIGWGVISGATLSRKKVFYSSNSDALVNLSAGDKIVLAVNPASVIEDSAKQIHSTQTTDATQTVLYVNGVSDYEAMNAPGITIAVHFTIVARQTAGSAGAVGDSYTAKYVALVETTVATEVLVAGPTEITDYTLKTTGFLGTVDFVVNAASFTYQIKVTGEVNKTIEWKAYVSYHRVR